MPTLVIRADATPATGAGHAMRSAALAEAWIDAELGDVVFWGRISLDYVITRLMHIGRLIKTAPAELLDAVLVCDHYGTDVRSGIGKLSGPALRVLVDDLGCSVAPGFDIVWNPNAYASEGLYRGFPGQVIGGTKYIPVRSDIPPWKPDGTRGTAVMLGGSSGILESLRDALADLDAEMSIGPLAGAGAWVPDGWSNLSRENPWSDIVRCRQLVTASGTSMWEAAKCGIPVVALLLAENQSKIFEWAVEMGTPGIDARQADKSTLREQLLRALGRPRKLPAIENGAGRVRDVLLAAFDQAVR